MSYDVLIKNARTRTSNGELLQIAIQDGKIQKVAAQIEGEARQVVDAGGRLVTESFVNGHLHLCKVYTLMMMDDEALGAYTGESMGGAMTAIELAARVKEKYDESWIIENVRKAVDLAVRFGNTHIRAFADTDTKARLEGVKALIRAREEYKDRVEIQVVAFPQDGLVRDPGAAELVRQALRSGVDLVGGIPHIERVQRDGLRHLELVFDLAAEFNANIDVHVDETDDPQSIYTEHLAALTIERGWQGRVTASHVCALASYSDVHAARVIDLLAEAEIRVVTNPGVNLHLQGRYDGYPKRRGLTRVRQLLDAGIICGAGQECIQDVFYPLGSGRLLEQVFLLVHAEHMASPRRLRQAVADRVIDADVGITCSW